MDFEVRLATVEDADELGAVHVASWRETYFPHILSEASFAVATPVARAERWREILESTGTAKTWVAIQDGRLIGFSGVGDPQDPDRPRPLHLYSLYVLAAAHGTGVGQALIDAALGGAPASLWVAEDNPRAQAFYRRNGFVPDGTRKVDTFILDEVAEIRMLRA